MANTTPNEKVYSITGLIWIICYKKISQYRSELYERFDGNMKVELDLSI